VLLRVVTDFRRAMDLSLVLDQEGIAHELRGVGEEQWALAIEDGDAVRAEAVLAAFELENPLLPRPQEKPRPWQDPLPAAWCSFLPCSRSTSGPAPTPPGQTGSSGEAPTQQRSCEESGGGR